MAKQPTKLKPLTVTEIILRGEADIIRQALAAREQIDTLLEEREAAYQRIAELEGEIQDITGSDASFPFPPPPSPVADFDAKAARPKPAAKPKAAAKPAAEPTPQQQPGDETPTANDDQPAGGATAEDSKD